jgi:cell division protein FtsW (lipid II flippase)
MVFSASFARPTTIRRQFYFVRQQLFCRSFGLFVMGVAIVSDYKWLKTLSVPLMVISIIFAVAVLFSARTHNATSGFYIVP